MFIVPWLYFCAYLDLGGWALSAVHQLNAAGYAVWLLAGMIFAVTKGRSMLAAEFETLGRGRLVRRFSRWLPRGFLLLAGLAFLGGAIYAPVNYDALAYRVPRVLHWLSENRWHWIHTDFARLNVRATGAEWIIAPLLALTGSTRLFFLPNIVSYLLLPGLFFSFFRRCGIGGKVSWHWMWIMTTGYAYVTQAGSIANDLPGAVYALAAYDLVLRLRQSGSGRDFRHFMIAAALLTGSKASAIPLCLPMVFIIWPRLNVLFMEPLKNLAAAVFAAFASFLPTALMNQIYCHDWTGMTLEGPLRPMPQQLFFNTCVLVMKNLTPPVFPFAAAWNRMQEKFFGAGTDLSYTFNTEELQTEEVAGLGLGLVLLIAVSIWFSRRIRRRSGESAPGSGNVFSSPPVLWSLGLSFVVYGLKAMVVGSCARLWIPYYAIFVAPLLVFFHEKLLQLAWWKCLVGIIFATAVMLVVVGPSRPLWPAQTILGGLLKAHPDSSFLERCRRVYSVYSGRANGFGPLVEQLPADAQVLGFISFDDPETSLWWPLGSRRVEHVTRNETRKDVQARHIKYILVNSRHFAFGRPPIEQQLLRFNAELILTVPLQLRAGNDYTEWYLMRLKPD